ncbi:Pectate lyase [Sphingobacterium nematocida]|uniref:Pectate lyase n=1 Tax=Sphingobacterium nematocida TaxID=1513896 RepID=A0A1T5BMK0_9SPHI|nr:pectate lyase [Sphingobacterium nematocida]SKB48093.1 Pectate lyase [Sphingobacterium nematocida]
MQKKTKLITKVLVFSSLLFTIFTFSQCQKEGVENLTIDAPNDVDLQSAVSTTSTSVFTVNVSKGISDGGFSVRIPMDANLISDTNDKPTASTVRVFENGVEIGPSHSVHQEIRNLGKGRFSHKSGFLFLSASDNSDPRTNRKKYTYTVGDQSITIPPVVPPTGTTDPPVSTNEPIGYASVNGKTTGGAGGQTVTVSTFSALQSAVSSSAPLIIQVSGTITGSGLLRVQSNKTILGLNGSKLIGASLFIYGKSNIIIRNMTISKVKTYSNIIIKGGAHHVWVDHCDLSSERVSDWDYYDGLLDVGTGADYVTLSWNKLYDNHKAMLIGFSYNEPESVGKLRVTVHNNYFYNVSERCPNVRYGTVHTFNNYYDNAGFVSSFMGAIVRVENSYFKNTTLPIRTELSPVAGVISGESTNIFDNSGKNKITTAPSNWVPTYEYKSVLSTAANVPSIVMKGAGATL